MTLLQNGIVRTGSVTLTAFSMRCDPGVESLDRPENDGAVVRSRGFTNLLT
jgi:hypothetical protein